MRPGLMIAAFAILAGLSACEKSSAPAKAAKEEAETPGITLTADEVESLGITTVAANAVQYRQQVSGYGVVTALDAIAQSDAEFLTAQAAAVQSHAAAARAQSLASGEDAAVSREVVETAQSKAAADQAALALASRKTEAQFGRGAPWRNGASRQAIMARLASGSAVMVRVNLPMGSIGSAVPASLRISRLGNNPQGWTTNTIWEAPADTTAPGRSLYALVDGSDLSQNEHVTVAVPVGAAVAGVSVPARALVYGESEAWVYVQVAPRNFVRTKIDIARPLGDGYFLANGNGIRAGQQIVVTGTGLLLAREINPSTEVEE